jgi:hypothetical protein
MHLMCHETVPGTPYEIGKPVTDPEQIKEILANPDLSKRFNQVPDGTFPATNTPKSYQAPPQSPPPASAPSQNESK